MCWGETPIVLTHEGVDLERDSFKRRLTIKSFFYFIKPPASQRCFRMNSKRSYTLHRHPVTLCGTMIYTGVGLYTHSTPAYPIDK